MTSADAVSLETLTDGQAAALVALLERGGPLLVVTVSIAAR